MPESRPCVARTRYWHPLPDGRVQCDLCPRFCRLREGQRGLCFVRERQDGEVVLAAYGRVSGFGILPVEKTPLFHFLPGTAALSFGTAGGNLTCRCCSGADRDRARDLAKDSDAATPAFVASLARQLGCRSVAFTGKEPVVFHEFARDVARACRPLGLRPLAVSAGYVCAEPRAELFEHLDAVTIELKALSESFYARFCAAHLEPVLDTLRHVRRRTSVWLEVTSPLVPGENDGDREIERLSGWIAGELGPDVPLHFSSFHPDGRMEDCPPPSPAALQRARYIALASGLRYVYVASPRDADGQATSCHGCGMRLIARDGDAITEWALGEDGACMRCGTPCAGVFEERPQHRLGACAPPAPREAAPA